MIFGTFNQEDLLFSRCLTVFKSNGWLHCKTVQILEDHRNLFLKVLFDYVLKHKPYFAQSTGAVEYTASLQRG